MPRAGLPAVAPVRAAQPGDEGRRWVLGPRRSGAGRAWGLRARSTGESPLDERRSRPAAAGGGGAGRRTGRNHAACCAAARRRRDEKGAFPTPNRSSFRAAWESRVDEWCSRWTAASGCWRRSASPTARLVAPVRPGQ
jgi:hypothetical protein